MTAPMTDASTAGTRTEAWTTAEQNAAQSARQFADAERATRAQAGLIADKPDMQETYDRLQREATAMGQNAEIRTGLAKGFATFRDLFSRGA